MAPSSVAPDGAKALAMLLERLGARLDTSGVLPATGRGRSPRAGRPARRRGAGQQVTGWAPARGHARRRRPLLSPGGCVPGPGPARPTGDRPRGHGLRLPGALGPGSRPRCDGRRRPARGAGRGLSPASRPAGDAFAVARDEGAGVVVSLGGADPWSNAYLGDDDNALLAADLLAPGRGYVVSWLLAPRVGGGTATLWSLVPSRVKGSLAGLAAALLAACLWQAKRLGRPVLEDPLVPVPGSELVVATGRLLARNGRSQETAAILRR